MKRLWIAIAALLALTANGATFPGGHPSTTDNDDSCDVALLPAATLLLPYFEVDIHASQTIARTTLFTVVNTSQNPQIARVTLWTDFGYPVTDFNIFLTGYDVQAINLFDVLARGVIGSVSGTSSSTPPGDRSLPNTSNPNFAASAGADCAVNPGPIPLSITNSIDQELTLGTSPDCGGIKIGGVHANAVGYATIDVVKTCTFAVANTVEYYNDLLYDNVLTGDFQIIDPNPSSGNYASGNPLVHIRAIPEGGAAGAVVATNLPYTFYDRYTPRATPAIDRRQPLPATFMARYIQGGTGAFNTNLEIWREGVTGSGAACADYQKNFSNLVTDVVRFDEHENPTTLAPCPGILCGPSTPLLPEASSTATSSAVFPPTVGSDVGGWLYLNLNGASSTAYSKPRHSQNWVVVNMFAEGRYSVAFDATMLSNGCTAAPVAGATIGPGPNSNP